MKSLFPSRIAACAWLLCLFATLPLATSSASAQEWAKQMLDKSPRHMQWVNVKYDHRTVQAFIVYPQVSHKAVPDGFVQLDDE